MTREERPPWGILGGHSSLAPRKLKGPDGEQGWETLLQYLTRLAVRLGHLTEAGELIKEMPKLEPSQLELPSREREPGEDSDE